MQEAKVRSKPLTWALVFLGLAIGVVAWPIILRLLTQVLWGYVLMALALPLARVLEKRVSQGLAATLSLTLLSLALILSIALLVPLLIRQGQELGKMVPYLMENAQSVVDRVNAFLTERGIYIDSLSGQKISDQMSQWMQSAFPMVLKKATSAAGTLSMVLPAPILAFYFLKDRESIACHIAMWVPLKHRQKAIAAAREMKREMSGFLRGQLLISVAVGGLTALGLLIVGVPAWLLLGILMGILELIPYVGPIIGAIPVAMFALPSGIGKALWALGVVVVVQQLESGMIAPRLMSGATNLHPVVVLLAISAGGILGGVMGMLIALPVVVSLRGAFRVLRLKNVSLTKRDF